MPIDPSMLAKSIGTLTDLHPDQDLPATLHQAVIAAKQLFDADAAIAIRTALLRDGVAYVQAGGGIVADSDPPTEDQETQNKAAAVVRAISVAENFTAVQPATSEAAAGADAG
jgi:hypothetical protein